MSIPIRCKTCGCQLGCIFEAFNLMRQKVIDEALEKNKVFVHPDNLDICNNVKYDLNDVFEMLGITKYQLCCRQTLTTTLNFYDAQNYKPTSNIE